ncbi:hypothetical protein BCR34DRAFT_621097 [Clohesyomyces aquaticus]|uniref:Uncharacterized protein n=1 Tax=Clohesyomyces aquaticus TaxID=1231657 RepID=A0A1Y2A9Q2_9PLEO|nr:hypothetical protein BCR34DRAFT_621097 [Clohesyomyces aquaticus]
MTAAYLIEIWLHGDFRLVQIAARRTIVRIVYRYLIYWSGCSPRIGLAKLDECCRRCVYYSSHAATKTTRNNRELFEYTSGRWIRHNEDRRLVERRLVFNVDELKNAAGNAVNRPASNIKSFRKLAEGGFNRVFDISIVDGSSILAPLPYPSMLPRRLTVASEVAAIAFYILMEKLPGRPLGNAWFELPKQGKLRVLHQIVELETKLFNGNLPASWGIYYAHDLPPFAPRIVIPGSDDGLCIGPYTAHRWWFGERGDLDIDRGPQKELAWIHQHGRPRFPFERAYRGSFGYKKQDPEKHAKSLANYLRLAHFLESMYFVPPRLPDDFESMDENERARAQELFRRCHVHFFYLGSTQRMNQSHRHALEQQANLLKRRIYDDAGSRWEDLNTPLQIDLVRVSQNWPKVLRANSDGFIPEFPIALPEDDIKRIFSLKQSHRDVDSDLEKISEKARSIREDGIVSVNDDPWLKEMSEHHWPLDDWDEDG